MVGILLARNANIWPFKRGKEYYLCLRPLLLFTVKFGKIFNRALLSIYKGALNRRSDHLSVRLAILRSIAISFASVPSVGFLHMVDLVMFFEPSLLSSLQLYFFFSIFG